MTTSAPVDRCYVSRLWESPFANDRGVPWSKRRYFFNPQNGCPSLWPCGDGIPSHGGWQIEAKTDYKGRMTVVDVQADEAAYKAQNPAGWPGMTYAEVNRCHDLSEQEDLPLRDAFLLVADLGKLTPDQKLLIAGCREVYSRKRPELLRNAAAQTEAAERLKTLEAKRADHPAASRTVRRAGAPGAVPAV